MMNFIVEYFYSLMYVIGLTVIIVTVFSVKITITRKIIYILSYSVIVNILTYVSPYLESYFILGNLLNIAGDYIYCGLIINRREVSNFMIVVFYNSTFGVLSAGITTLLINFNQWKHIDTMYGQYRGIISFSISFLTTLIVYLILKDKEYVFDNISNKNIIYYVCINTVQLAIVLLLNILIVELQNRYVGIMMMMMLLILLMILVNYFIIYSAENFIEKGKLELVENTYILMKQYLEDLKSEELKWRKVKHDIKNHTCVLNDIIDNNPLEAKQYLNKLIGSVDNISTRIKSGNIYVDAIINSKIKNNNDIKFEVSAIVDQDLNIAEDKLCALLFNLIDNAVEAARLSVDKVVIIKIKSSGKMLFINVTNSYKPPFDFNSKKGKGHGNGMKIINEIIKTLNGKIKYRDDSDRIICDILINI